MRATTCNQAKFEEFSLILDTAGVCLLTSLRGGSLEFVMNVTTYLAFHVFGLILVVVCLHAKVDLLHESLLVVLVCTQQSHQQYG